MIDEILEQSAKKKQPTLPNTIVSAKSKSTFTPPRFSVSRLRKHPGIQANRNPFIVG
jgi:hypothetical protein